MAFPSFLCLALSLLARLHDEPAFTGGSLGAFINPRGSILHSSKLEETITLGIEAIRADRIAETFFL